MASSAQDGADPFDQGEFREVAELSGIEEGPAADGALLESDVSLLWVCDGDHGAVVAWAVDDAEIVATGRGGEGICVEFLGEVGCGEDAFSLHGIEPEALARGAAIDLEVSLDRSDHVGVALWAVDQFGLDVLARWVWHRCIIRAGRAAVVGQAGRPDTIGHERMV